ncbi:hypothetical protein BGZ94_004566 [Podila epigama]|nr:hypothetical protein BGZ94_004566 [Podila epigama]
MTENPYLSLIANLNSGSPLISSPIDDFSADLALWTNAEFTFDMPPGLGIFEHDSGFDVLSSMNHPAHVLAPEAVAVPVTAPVTAPVSVPVNAPIAAAAPEPKQAVIHNPQSALDQQHLMEYLNLTQDSRPQSLVERTRRRNPVKAELTQAKVQQPLATVTPSPQLQEQAAAINAFHSLLAAYSASQTQQLQQQLQQPQSVQMQQNTQTLQRPTQSSQGLPLLLPNIAPATAPTTPAAAKKLLRQPSSPYKAVASGIAKKAKAPRAIAAATTPPTSPVLSSVPFTPIAPKSPTTANATAIAAAATAASTAKAALAKVNITATANASAISSGKRSRLSSEERETDDGYEEELAADSLLSKDDPDYLTKLAAEEDKRRRNTAASARFRYKKKLREQALEQTAKEQTVRAETLEARVKELEMEVKWLRGLIVEKDSRLHEVTSNAAADDHANKRIKIDAC